MTVLAVAGTTLGQSTPPQPDDGPVVIGEHRGKYELFELARFAAELEFYGRTQSDKIKQPTLPTLKDTEEFYRSTINLNFEAYIGHKNLIDLSGTTKFGLEYTHTKSDSLNEKRNDLSFTNLYDVQALILGEGPVPVTVYSRRDESNLNREFFGTLKNTTSETGIIARIKSEFAPTTLQYFHREQDESDPLGTIDSSLIQDTAHLESQIRLAEHQRLELDYTFDSAQEKQAFGYRNAYDRHDGTFTHTVDFGRDFLDSLRSSIRIFDQSGLYEQSTYRLDEQLRLHHTDTLETRYNLTLDEQSRGGIDQRLVSGNATVRHKLYESLISTATAGGSHVEIPDIFTSDELFVSGNLDYTKKVPVGRLSVSTGLGYNEQDNSERGQDIPVLDDTYVFNDPFPVTISRRNVVASSITVTTTTHAPLFEGLDYTVQTFPDRVEVRRILGGAIANGQAVLITYDIGPEPGSIIDTTSGSISARLNFENGPLEGASFYTTFRKVDHSLRTIDPSRFVLDDFNDLLYGVEYKLGDLTLLLERQNHDSVVSPYDTTRFQARFDQRFSPESAINLEYTREVVDYLISDDHLELDRVSARWAQKLDQNLAARIEVQYRNETDQISDDVRGWDQAIELTWKKGQTTIYGSFHNAIINSASLERTSQTFTFGFRRQF